MSSWIPFFAWKQLFPSRSRGSFLFYCGTLGIALAVTVLIVVQCVMGGLQDEICSHIRQTEGDLTISSTGPIFHIAEWKSKLEKIPEVQKAEPFLAGFLLLSYENRPSFVFVRGLDFSRTMGLSAFRDQLSPDGEIYIGAGLARSMGVRTGSRLEVFSPNQISHLREGEVLLPQDISVSGTFSTGWNALDNEMALVSLPLMEELFDLHDGAHGFALMINRCDEESFCRFLNEKFLPPGFVARSWKENHHDLMQVLRLERVALSFVLFFLLLLAIFSIASGLVTNVLQRTRHFGLLLALGSSRRAISACFLVQSLILSLIGSGFGLVLASVVLVYRNSFLHLFSRPLVSQKAVESVYQLTQLPVRWDLFSFLFIPGATILLGLGASFLPIRRILRLDPDKALRYE